MSVVPIPPGPFTIEVTPNYPVYCLGLPLVAWGAISCIVISIGMIVLVAFLVRHWGDDPKDQAIRARLNWRPPRGDATPDL
jgi:hypothetical protein